MGVGRQKMKAKIAGAFVGLRGIISVILLGIGSLGGADIGLMYLFSFLIAMAMLFSGIGVVMGYPKAYFAGGLLTNFHLVLSIGSLLGILIDIAIIGALIAGYGIQSREKAGGGVRKY